MTDREERQHVIEVLKQMKLDYEDFWEENDTEEIKAFNYAIASIETDLKYDLLYEETIEQKKPTTETCETCRYYGSHHGVCDYCYKCSLWTEKEPNKSEIPTGSTTKDNLGVDCISRADAIHAVSEALERTFVEHEDIANKLIGKLPSVTPQELRWIPVSEKLPKDLEPVNITWINHDPEPYYNDIKDKPFTATGVYFNGQWYWWSTLCTDILAEYSHNYDDIVDDDIEITAWQPLPQSYEPQESEE